MSKPILQFTTFRKPTSLDQHTLTRVEPYCFNGTVSIRQYKVTVEEVEEPKEVLEGRLRELWRACDNHHHWKPLQAEAKKLGITLSHDDRK